MNKLNIVADENIPLLDEYLGAVANITRLPGRQIQAAQLKEADVLLVRSVTEVNEALLIGSHVRFVGTCTIGVDHIDTAYLKQKGMGFASAPGCNAEAVADYIMSVLFSIYVDLAVLRGKSVGIIGLGQVGSRVAKRLKALGVAVKAYDPFKAEAENSLAEVLACDVISLHVPLVEEGAHKTLNLLDKQTLAELGDGTLLINTSRGRVVDNQALLEELQNHRLRAVLDVYQQEPAPSIELLKALEFATAHIAGYSLHGKVRGSLQVVEQLFDFFKIPNEIPNLLDKYKGMLPVQANDTALDLVKKIYPVGSDAASFMALYEKAQGKEEQAKAFDAYRKNYRTRYEFGFITLTGATTEQKAVLSAVGFKLPG